MKPDTSELFCPVGVKDLDTAVNLLEKDSRN